MAKTTVSALMLLMLGAWFLPGTSRVRPPGVIAPRTPEQHDVQDTRPWKIEGGLLVRPLAQFSARARVLLADHYRFGREARVAPVDLTLGWGNMSDSSVLEEITLRHWHRYYTWYTKTFPIPGEEIVAASANMHMIPANERIADRLWRAVPGDLVEFDGYLVEVASADGWNWRSSLSRDDSGNGACELVWLDRLVIEP